MNEFTRLYQSLDQAAGNRAREQALQDYFSKVDSAEASWAVFVLGGGKVNSGKNRIASTTDLRQWVGELAQLPLWLVEDSYRQVGDLAETLALLVSSMHVTPRHPPEAPTTLAPKASSTLHEWIEAFLLPLVAHSPPVRKQAIQAMWLQLDEVSRLVFNKLLTGSLRVGVSRRTLQISLARIADVPLAEMAHRMVGEWIPTPSTYDALMSPAPEGARHSRPYPFFLASALPGAPESLGSPEEWQAEWKWDGIRIQMVHPAGQSPYLWSRGEERLDGRFPELEESARGLPSGIVLDGELLAWDATQNLPKPFIALQKRIQTRKPSAALIQRVPVRILFYDILEEESHDVRERPLSERRILLESLLGSLIGSLDEPAVPTLGLSPRLHFNSWIQLAEIREQSAEHNAEGIMLKSLDSPYREGRKRGDWWKWKIDPLTIDAVLIYAQSGSGRRSMLHTDYTFGLWNEEGKLVPVAKAYSGLTDREILAVDKWIRSHTIERFGPVRAVEPQLVFELAFEAVNHSTRHKSGVAVRFPRILRQREDKAAADADHVQTLRALCRD